MAGLNFIEQVVGAEMETIASAGAVAVIVTGCGMIALKRSSKASNPLVPDDSLTIRNLMELIAQFILMLGDNVMGKVNRKHLPFIATIFCYIFFCNILGLIPGFSMPTDSVSFNIGIALLVFIFYNAWGIKEVGPVAYFKHLWGPVALAGPLLLVIETISHFVRPISLSLRLFGNMTGDHIVLQVFTDLTKYVIPVIFYGLGTFVCFMQAFVFTLLTMVYIRFAVAHEEEH